MVNGEAQENKKCKLATRQNRMAVVSTRPLLEEIRSLILQTREGVAQAVNSVLVSLYWEVGNRIRTDVLQSQRAGYGEEIVATLSRELTAEFGRGYSEKALWRMVQFSQVFEDREIVEFYAEMCRAEKWSVRSLPAKVQGTR
jgi:hypothetical protein